MPNSFIPPEVLTPSQWLSDPYQGSTQPFYLVLADVFGLLLVLGLIAYVFAPRLMRRHRVRQRLFRQLMGWLATIGALGLFWTVARLVGAPLFARPLWLWLTLIGLIAVLAYHAYYWRRRYPAEVNAYEEQLRRRRWMPAPRKRAAARRR
jgi:hypothetical protein